MARLSWNSFVKKYPNTPAFMAGVSAQLPTALRFDKNRKKLPTAYGLFQEWLDRTLAGDWTSAKLPGGFAVLVATTQDSALITARFHAIGPARATSFAHEATPIGYRDSDYGALASQLGYRFK